MNICVVAGLNNLIRGESIDEIMKHLENFYTDVSNQSKMYHPDNPSTFTMATLIYAGKLCWMKNDGNLPYDGYINKYEMMSSLNSRIVEFNKNIFSHQIDIYRQRTAINSQNIKCKSPKFHLYGVQIKKNKKGEKIERHRWSWWRQNEPHEDSLHLADKRRVTMGKAVGNYYKGMFVADSHVLDESALVPGHSGDNKEEDTLVIGIEQDDLFLSDGEAEGDRAKELKYKDSAKKRDVLRNKIKCYLEKRDG